MPRREEDATVGEDSFLDTTANLVGILIILVVVVGTKTKIAADEHSRKLAEVDAAPRLEQPSREARQLQDSLVAQAQKQQEYELETQYRAAERDSLLAHVQLARQRISDEISELNEDKQASILQTQELEKIQAKLEQVNEQMGAAEEHERPTVLLEHLPTPMAQTVFSRELHVQLKNGMVTVIPWDRLVEVLKAQVPLAARRQASKKVLEETLGPVGGFLLRYRMLGIPGGFELDRFELETTPDATRETLAESLATAGMLRLELASRRPAETVVTVWVYPDSFGEFGQLKSNLFAEGFLCAARPLPDGVRIGASPNGSRSTAQ
jgi:hypothetical protein